MSKQIKRKVKNIKLLLIAALLAGFAVGFFVGKESHSSRAEFCRSFAQKYLEDFIANEVDGNEVLWNRAIDVETDFFSLCTLDLDESSLSSFKSIVVEKYSNNAK